ncbi:MAG: hypothetical protein Q4D29_00115 [Lachnospiraceae bacterium]|nr:hypothetical protein [Lachnospiraceae bacterium]
MKFIEYLQHYTDVTLLLPMVLVTLFILLVIHIVTFLLTKATGGDYRLLLEKYYELIISITSMLFFIGMFFLVEHRYFDVSEQFYEIWNKYDDFLLLLALFISIFFINFIDTFIIPLKLLYKEEKATLRMMAMIYMLFIFAYIKYIYKNDNYDSIIVYFIIMVVGRFIYFDASFTDFLKAMKNLFLETPMLLLGLATTAIVAWFGFGTEYLLKSNGVVLSLWIAHVFVVIEIAIIHLFIRSSFRKKPDSKYDGYYEDKQYEDDYYGDEDYSQYED